MTKNAREKCDKKREEVEIIKRNAQDLNVKGIIIEREKERQGKHQQGKKPKRPNKDKKDNNKENKEEKEEKRKARKYKKKKPDNKEKVDKEVNAMLSSLGLASLPSKSDLDSLHCVYHEVANLVRDCAQNKLNE